MSSCVFAALILVALVVLVANANVLPSANEESVGKADVLSSPDKQPIAMATGNVLPSTNVESIANANVLPSSDKQPIVIANANILTSTNEESVAILSSPVKPSIVIAEEAAVWPCAMDCPLNSIDAVCGLRWSDFELRTFLTECEFLNYNCDTRNEIFYNVYDGTCAEAKQRYAKRLAKTKTNVYMLL